MANMHVVYHTWRAYSPSLSERWLAGRPRAALFSKWSTFRVKAGPGLLGSRVHSSLLQYFVKFDLYAPACLAEIWVSLSQRRPRFQRDKRPHTPQWPGVTSCNNLSSLQFEWPFILAIRDENSSAIRQVGIKLNQKFQPREKTTNPSKWRTQWWASRSLLRPPSYFLVVCPLDSHDDVIWCYCFKAQHSTYTRFFWSVLLIADMKTFNLYLLYNIYNPYVNMVQT